MHIRFKLNWENTHRRLHVKDPVRHVAGDERSIDDDIGAILVHQGIAENLDRKAVLHDAPPKNDEAVRADKKREDDKIEKDRAAKLKAEKVRNDKLHDEHKVEEVKPFEPVPVVDPGHEAFPSETSELPGAGGWSDPNVDWDRR